MDYEIPDDAQKQREEAARKMQAQIEALPEADALTKEDGDVVDAAKAAFDALDDETKALVSESMKTKLTACVSRMEELRKEPELPADPVERFAKLMEAVPGKKDKVWNTDGAAIDAARACYDEINLKQLDKTQQKQVKTLYAQLTAAEKPSRRIARRRQRSTRRSKKLPFETPADMTLTHEKDHHGGKQGVRQAVRRAEELCQSGERSVSGKRSPAPPEGAAGQQEADPGRGKARQEGSGGGKDQGFR